MGWQKVAELRYAVDETRPGFEVEDDRKWKCGEEIEVTINPDWPAFPRLEIREHNVIAETLTCVLGSGAELEIVDKTGEDELTMPPPGQAYLSLHNGSEFDLAYVYLHVSRLGEKVYLDYEYYPGDDRWAYLAIKDGAVCGATDRGRFYRLGDVLQRVYDIPGAPNSLSRDGTRAGGRSLFRFGRRHRPAMRTVNGGESPRALAASLAVSYDGELSYTPERILSLSNRRRTKDIVVAAEFVLEIATTRHTMYEAVRVVFDGGEVVIGNGRELQVNLPTISDVGIARSVAERIRKAASESGAVHRVSAMGDFNVSIGDTLLVPGMFRGTVTEMKRYLDKEKTDLEVLTPKKGGEAFEQNK